MIFEIFKSEKDRRYYFHLKARNGKIVLSSQGYASKQGCERGIASVKRNSKDKTRYESKASKNARHYFLIRARNGQIVGTSQLYKTLAACQNGITAIFKGAEIAQVRT